eukprot:gene41489-50629_t
MSAYAKLSCSQIAAWYAEVGEMRAQELRNLLLQQLSLPYDTVAGLLDRAELRALALSALDHAQSQNNCILFPSLQVFRGVQSLLEVSLPLLSLLVLLVLCSLSRWSRHFIVIVFGLSEQSSYTLRLLGRLVRKISVVPACFLLAALALHVLVRLVLLSSALSFVLPAQYQGYLFRGLSLPPLPLPMPSALGPRGVDLGPLLFCWLARKAAERLQDLGARSMLAS